MNHTFTTLIAALALSGTAAAQAPAAPDAPVSPARQKAAVNANANANVNSRHDDREPTADEELALAALEGLMAPDFTLPDVDGTPRTLSQLRGRKVFLATWASW